MATEDFSISGMVDDLRAEKAARDQRMRDGIFNLQLQQEQEQKRIKAEKAREALARAKAAKMLQQLQQEQEQQQKQEQQKEESSLKTARFLRRTCLALRTRVSITSCRTFRERGSLER